MLSRLGNPEMLGEVALGLAIASPVFLMSQLQLRSLQATDASHAEYRPGDYLALRIVMTVLALAVIAGVIIAGRYRGETALVILAVAAAKACDSLSDVFYGQLQQYEEHAAHCTLNDNAWTAVGLRPGYYRMGHS